jgi:hypothetical protein
MTLRRTTASLERMTLVARRQLSSSQSMPFHTDQLRVRVRAGGGSSEKSIDHP